MKKLLLRTIALTTLMAGPLPAQTLTGTWQGTIQPPQGKKEVRIVIKISTTDADKLKALLYNADVAAPGLAASAVTRNGTTVKITFEAIGGSYEGKLNADGNSMVGTFAQGASQGTVFPLNLTRATPETAWTIPEPPPPPKAMPEDARPSFEVATIKPSKADERFSFLVNRSGMLNATSTSLAYMIQFAYDLHPRQITGGPAWLEEEKYAVSGKPDTPGQPSMNQLRAMVQKLLADRFALSFHREKKELSVYAITIAKGGAKLTKNDSNPKGLPGFSGQGPRGTRVFNATMTEFAGFLQAGILERPVVDRTGLEGARYNFVLKWTPDASQRAPGGPDGNVPPAADNPDAPPDIFAAVVQQLGLQLQSTKAPVDVLVIDHVEKPSPN